LVHHATVGSGIIVFPQMRFYDFTLNRPIAGMKSPQVLAGRGVGAIRLRRHRNSANTIQRIYDWPVCSMGAMAEAAAGLALVARHACRWGNRISAIAILRFYAQSPDRRCGA
jgi:hypothetical protein